MPNDSTTTTTGNVSQNANTGAGSQPPAGKGTAGKGGGSDAAAPIGGPKQADGAPEQHMSAFERAKARRASGAANPASDSPAAGLSSGKTSIQKERGLDPSKSVMEQLREKSRKHNPAAKPVEAEIVADESAMPGHGPSEVGEPGEPEIAPLAPAPGETEIPKEEGSLVSTPVGDHTPGEEEAPAEPAFTPNLKYKAFGQEHDIPEKFRGLITDPESEREVHQVFERAHAFDRYKATLTQLDADIKQKIVPELQFYRQTKDNFNALLQKGDIFGVLGKMGMPREKVLQAVADRIRIEQLPPEQREAYDAREHAQAISEQAASQIQQMQLRMQNLESLAKHSAIQSTFARGDVRSVADDFDKRVGQTGSFEALVRDHGALLYSQGKDITPEEAVQAVMQRFGLSVPAQPAAAPAKTPQQVRPVTTTPMKVLPNVPSRAAATRSRPQINGVADIRKAASQMRGRIQ